MQTIGPYCEIATGRWVRITIDGTQIRVVEPCENPAPSQPTIWVSPGFWDIQTNGRWGISFASDAITEDHVRRIAIEHARSGVTKLFPTLITAPAETLLHGVKTIAAACERWPIVNHLVGGIHLEGPWISPIDGYRGAHALEAIRSPDFEEFQRLQDASGGRIRIVTLAPEVPGAIRMIERLTDSGVVVAIGHTAANGAILRDAVAAGASLSTHLGNGIASHLPRHPNAIWHQAADDNLMASFIADGEHLDDATLCVLARSKGFDRTILVSDLSPLAGLLPGVHGDWEVTASGKVVLARTDYLAGSNVMLDEALSRFRRVVGWDRQELIATVTRNPARLLGRKEPDIAPGEAADLVIFRWNEDLEVIQTLVGGENIEGVPPALSSHRG